MPIGGSVALRPSTSADQPFLAHVYASTREEELTQLGWDETARTAFLRGQFETQDRSYRLAHPHASFDLIEVDGISAGRLYVERSPTRIHVIDISLLPEHRGRGIGSELLAEIIDEARRARSRVTLSVLRANRALTLYERLGFRVTGGDEVYLHLEWVSIS